MPPPVGSASFFGFLDRYSESLQNKMLEQLEANILAEGVVIPPLIVWNSVMVDGQKEFARYCMYGFRAEEEAE